MEIRDAKSSLDIDPTALLASQYAFYYTDGTRITPALVEAYEGARGALRLSELVRRLAVSHAQGDIDWSEEHFQERGSEDVLETAALFALESQAPPRIVAPPAHEGRDVGTRGQERAPEMDDGRQL